MALKAADLVKQAREYVEYKKDKKNKIAYITFNRESHFNAVTVGMRLLYGDLIHRANVDDDVKVLVIRGKGDHLGTGGDLDEQNSAYADSVTEAEKTSLLHEFEIDDPDVKYPSKDSFRYIHALCDHYAKARGGCRSLQEFKKISIIECKGYCYGWHFYQTGDADLVVCAEDALFGHPAFRYVGWGPRLWTWVEMMGLRKFQEMLFTGRPFTGKEMFDCSYVNSVVSRDKLEEETEKYALACSRSRPIDSVSVQKTFMEIYKQHRGEYMGSLLTGLVESLWPYMKHEEGDVNFGKAMEQSNIAGIVKNAESQFPPEWRMSVGARKRK